MSGLLINIARRSLIYSVVCRKLEAPTSTPFLNRHLAATPTFPEKQNVEAKRDHGGDKKKGKESPKITLLGKNDAITVISLEEAQNLARRRNMRLVKVVDYDVKTQRASYRMLTTAEFIADEVSDKKSTVKKHEKLLNIGSRIAEHDLASRLKNISKWLEKGNEVRILIQGTNGNDPGLENIYKAIEAIVSEGGGRIVQKNNRGGNMKFTILPNITATPSSGGKDS